MRQQPVRANELAERAFREHEAHIYRFLLRRTNDTLEAEELTQRVFVDAAAAAGRTDLEPESILAWLCAIAERRFIDEVRRRSRARRHLLLAGPLESGREAPTHHEGVVEAVTTAIERLPVEQRQIVVMKLLEDRPFVEIAVTVGASAAACKMRFSRGLREVRDYLARRGFEPSHFGES